MRDSIPGKNLFSGRFSPAAARHASWLVAALFLPCFVADSTGAEKRLWTARSGHQVIATLEDQTEDAVSLRIANQPQPVVVMLSELSEQDLAYLKAHSQKEPKHLISKPGAHINRMQNPLFAINKTRMEDRRAQTLEARREYNASKGPAVYSLGTVPNPMLPMGTAIENGWVQQPTIYSFWRPRVYLDRDRWFDQDNFLVPSYRD